ncbi:MAG: rane protein of unknown function [Blastococcus sp.]|nr:rane protein of unknown function [Blastococcus sp.]
MTSPRRAVAALLALLPLFLLGNAPPATAAGESTADSVVIVGVPGLTWRDVDPDVTPELWGLADVSPIGAVSVRAGRSTTCVLDGWATLGAGNRARYPGPEEGLPPVPLPTVPLPDEPAGATATPAPDDAGQPRLDTSMSHCGLQERTADVGLAEPGETVRRTAEDPGTARFGAEPGALGAAVGCAAVSGRAAALAVAAEDVRLNRTDALPGDKAELAAFLDECPLALVSLDELSDAGTPGPAKTDQGTEPGPRSAALAAIDEEVGRIRAAVADLPGDTLLVVAGIAEVNDGRAQLHVGIVSGPGFSSPGWLGSASTGRAPYVQLIDVAPTALEALGLNRPASMNGQPLRVAGDRPPLGDAIAQLDRINTAATVHYRTVGRFFWLLVIVSAALVASGVLVLGSGRSGRPRPARGGRALRILRTLALAAAGLPIATYLAGLAPWEAAGAPLPSMVAAVIVADVVLVAVAVLGPWRRRRLGPPLAVLAVTLGTLLADVLTGSTLELNGLLGYDAIVAGRFTGYGNLSFGLLAVSALLGTAAAATAAGRRAGPDRARRVSGAVVLAVGLVTVGIIGAPGLGRDFGGVLGALPGFLLLAMFLARVRVTVVRLVAVLAAAVLVVGAVAVLDWLRPADERSHLGRFVEQVLTGEAWTVVSRKGAANLDILLGSPLAWMLPVALVAAVWLVRPGGLLRHGSTGRGAGPGGLSAADLAVLRSALVACALSLTIGAAVNDSGVALPATAAALLVPLMVWLAAAPRPAVPATDPGTGEDDGTPARSGPAEGPDRVTVVSRGSTVWNT